MAGRWGTLVGQKFNMLTVVSFHSTDGKRRFWNLKCDCGNTKVLDTSVVKHQQSCGCLSKNYFHDLTGHSFNGNLAIRYIGQNNQKSHVYEFRCHCGNKFESEGNDIKSNKIRSCGCRWNSDKILNADREGTIHNMIYSQYKKAAEDRGYVFNLSKDQVKRLVLANCYYCNSIPLNKKYNDHKKHYSINYNGIDRLDNNIGYEIDNVVTACKYCNQAKHTMTATYFKEVLNRIFKAKQDRHGFWKDEN